ncbi:MAG: hypothetical protein L0287_11035, partial [Anaerolineae bacterium]|nr:hypothetical protein [Anaerolineae bacterium]
MPDTHSAQREDVIVVENYVDRQCIRHMHLISNSQDSLLPAQREGGGEIKQGTGIYYYRAEYPYRGVLDIHCEGWSKFRRLVVWSFEGYASVRDAIRDASNYFWRAFRFEPGYCFFRRLPAGVEFGQDFPSP